MKGRLCVMNDSKFLAIKRCFYHILSIGKIFLFKNISYIMNDCLFFFFLGEKLVLKSCSLQEYIKYLIKIYDFCRPSDRYFIVSVCCVNSHLPELSSRTRGIPDIGVGLKNFKPKSFGGCRFNVDYRTKELRVFTVD